MNLHPSRKLRNLHVAPPDRRGFTLVELLVVIVIIGILAAILLPVIAGAVTKARIREVQSEINLIETALTEFKSTYGVFPPSRIHLHEDPATYDLGGGSNPSLHQALDRRTIQFLKRIWAKFDVTTPVDWNASGQVSTNEPGMVTQGIDLNGSECLVFFLGGMPLLAPGNVRANEGFSRNPNFPFSRPLNDGNNLPAFPLILGYNQRRESLFQFEAARLSDVDLDGFWEYYDPVQERPNITSPGQFDPAVMAHPYAYFSGYDGQGYNWLRLPNGVVLTYDNAWFDAAGNPRGLLFPFSMNVAAAGLVQWWNDKSYQIISPGVSDNGLMGNGLTPDPNSIPNSIAVFNPDNPSYSIDQALSSEAQDNITNFSAGQLRDVE